MDHLRFSGQPFDQQLAAFEEFVRGEPLLMDLLARLRDLDLNDWWVVSGVLYNNVWNRLLGMPLMTGVKDIDVFYFDDSDLSYAAEDQVIKAAEPHFADMPVPVEIRNQARVHLWFEDHFGQPREPLQSCKDSINGFSSKTHAVGVRLESDDRLTIYAPYGLNEIYSFRLVPNPVNANKMSYDQKAERAKSVWPQLVVEPWV